MTSSAELVVTHLAKNIAVAHRNEVVKLIDAAVAGERQNAFFRKQIVEFKFAEFDVQPRAAEQVVQPRHDGFKVKSAGGVGRRQQEERKILFQRAAGVEVQAAQVKAGTSDALDRGSGGRGVSRQYVSTNTFPVLTRCQIGVMRNVTGQ